MNFDIDSAGKPLTQILDLSADTPRILRPGRVTAAELQTTLGTDIELSTTTDDAAARRSPLLGLATSADAARSTG